MMDKQQMISPESALTGRSTPLIPSEPHVLFGTQLNAPVPTGMEEVVLGMGCFWGAERLFWRQPGVLNTAVGYSGGYTPNPTYQEVCTGQTGHTEVVRVVFDPSQTSLENLLAQFWENHDPTQGMRQGNDIGTQYRSVIFTTNDSQQSQAENSKARYQTALQENHREAVITTEIKPAPAFFFAEDDHQQYLEKNPQGYCGLGGTGICLPPQ
ncbi:peptide-methionine (S)-S-oxide reductase MsrA [Photobacterium galatheae]|uniref:Peptide methionine sulfoxide reductase MsrA n=1 Tax=Photobacterium galatheae TaxID=1654360 RepID=A0A066RXW0_9GAMM|nr:peptide-methionine (S)-S-oxide reductase MsrA [Photobacterium galatheae]KDM92542.1 methionine sulfoxide reductase A [Photobacterium galatheae]MCM0148018.1 peptide-methionine (S)-S-oxide reductase MsrA [Photobacterium galatheae]